MPSSEKKQGFLEEKMLENCPKCPLCKSEEGFRFFGWSATKAECKNCGATWRLSSDVMKLLKESKDGEGYQLVNKVFPYDFWQKLSASETMTEKPEPEEPVTVEREAPREAAEEAAEEYEREGAGNRSAVLFMFVSSFLILVVTSSILRYMPYFVPNLSDFQTFLTMLEGILFADAVVMGICLLFVVRWVAHDGKDIRDLKAQIRKLRRNIDKKE